MLDPDKVKLFCEHLPLCVELGMTVEKASDGEFALVLPYDQALVGDKATGVIHGGLVSILLDTCCGAEAFVHPRNAAPTATIDLRIDYMRPALPEHKIYARAEIYHMSKNVAFMRGVAWDRDYAKPIAMAVGTFTFSRKEEKA